MDRVRRNRDGNGEQDEKKRRENQSWLRKASASVSRIWACSKASSSSSVVLEEELSVSSSLPISGSRMRGVVAKKRRLFSGRVGAPSSFVQRFRETSYENDIDILVIIVWTKLKMEKKKNKIYYFLKIRFCQVTREFQKLSQFNHAILKILLKFPNFEIPLALTRWLRCAMIYSEGGFNSKVKRFRTLRLFQNI